MKLVGLFGFGNPFKRLEPPPNLLEFLVNIDSGLGRQQCIEQSDLSGGKANVFVLDDSELSDHGILFGPLVG